MSDLDPLIDKKKPFNWYLESLSDDSDTLGIAFSASTGRFEWFNSFEYRFDYLKFKKIYVTDVWKVWWHGPYRNLEEYGYKALEKFLRKKIEEQNIKKVFTIGSSLAGYGAILFGCLLNVDLVLAFSPQTLIDKQLDERHQIYSRFEMIKKQHPDFGEIEETNLKEIITKYGQNNKTKYKLFYGLNNSYDVKHIENIASLSGVTTHPISVSTHRTGEIFLRNGTVEKELKDFIKI